MRPKKFMMAAIKPSPPPPPEFDEALTPRMFAELPPPPRRLRSESRFSLAASGSPLVANPCTSCSPSAEWAAVFDHSPVVPRATGEGLGVGMLFKSAIDGLGSSAVLPGARMASSSEALNPPVDLGVPMAFRAARS